MSVASRPAAWVATGVQLVLQHVLTCAVPPSSPPALHHAATPDALLIRAAHCWSRSFRASSSRRAHSWRLR
ncbi:hypothetical protein PF005_g1731 [Phytophthora fragariae]|uniref:Secreted protein n=1 Tax=Phytophthora fragariae TaxID=53985 RepID=A0A6A3ZG91_9STRA|nr:hypothetical protein PF003_g34208 [Phytophthora fragariae]KAE8947393.1 hypothetical protein PF009_g2981 [Phytophthora fragariae]KAE9127526.1 hypothetical protein PF010_g4848 [Phytophthora fragariae]KAE9234831.1 hypothetical protein PF005_g1731 [Phytophthora fragariae]KAE9321629.1 hypothetical protein PF001_g4818 [Phytophthora fragariae]